MVALTEATRAHIDHWLSKFPADRKRSALLQGIFAAQEQNNGWLTDELIAAVARYLGLPPVWAYEVATFYSLYNLQPVGKYKLTVCTNLPCMLSGGVDAGGRRGRVLVGDFMVLDRLVRCRRRARGRSGPLPSTCEGTTSRLHRS